MSKLEDKLITEENLNEYKKKELAALELYLFRSEDAMFDTTPIPIEIKKEIKNKICFCGTILYSLDNKFSCGSCGRVIYKK